MATTIQKNNLVKIPSAGPVVIGNKTDDNMMGGINSFMGNLVQVIGQADKLIGSYATIKDKLGPMLGGQPKQGMGAQAAGPPPGAQRQLPPPPPQTPVEPAVRNPTPPEAIAMTQDKVERAEDLFKELHEKIKPYIPVLKTMSADTVLQMAMQPKNKKKIIEQIAARL